MTFDQRTYAPVGGALAMTSAAEAANFQLLDANGNAIAPATNVSRVLAEHAREPPAPPGVRSRLARGRPAVPGTVTQVYLTYPSPAVQVGNAKAIEIRGRLGGTAPFNFAAIGGDVFNTAGDPAAAGNLQQIVSPISVAATTHLRASSHSWR